MPEFQNHIRRKLHFEPLESKDLLTTVGFEQHTVISTSDQGTPNLSSISPADIDGDGDIDIVTSSFGDNKIAWLENLDGKGSYSVLRLINLEAIGASTIRTADLDGDGDIDIVSSTLGRSRTDPERQVGWYENLDGKGTFDSVKTITSNVPYAPSLFVLDVDQDGVLDVITENQDRRTVWFRNDGSETLFGGQALLFSMSEPEKLAHLSDLDGDGDGDYILFNSDYSEIGWYDNFEEALDVNLKKVIPLETPLEFPMLLADVDGDGDDDLIIGKYAETKTLRWRENIGGGQSFGPERTIDSEFPSAMLFYASDIDGDGDNDLLAGASRGTEFGALYLYRNLDGIGTFGERIELSNEVNIIWGITSADLDGDGDLDLISASTRARDGKVSWYENLENQATFGGQRSLTAQVQGVSSLSAADLDGDGDADLVSASTLDGRIAWYENLDGRGTFSQQRLLTANAFNTQSVVLSDLDSDGDLDILYSRSTGSSRQNPSVYWHENRDRYGDFGSPQAIHTLNSGTPTVLSADINGDGQSDIIVTSRDDDSVSWYENLGSGRSWGNEQPIARDVSRSSEYTSAAGDIDGDGDIDIFSSSSFGSNLIWYENLDGKGTFLPNGIPNFSGGSSRAISIADLDNDGDLDVLAAGDNGAFGNSNILWFENLDGQGSFSEERFITSDAQGTRSLAVADMDGDGDLDVLSASAFEEDKIAWYENLDGKGAFGPQNIITDQLLGSRAIIAVDIDGDGDNDVVTGSADDGKILWFETRKVGDSNNDGHFNFSDLVAILQTGEYEDDTPTNSKFSEGDWNGDGDFTSADLVLAFQAGMYESPVQQAVGSLFAEREWYSELIMRKVREVSQGFELGTNDDGSFLA